MSQRGGRGRGKQYQNKPQRNDGPNREDRKGKQSFQPKEQPTRKQIETEQKALIEVSPTLIRLNTKRNNGIKW